MGKLFVYRLEHKESKLGPYNNLPKHPITEKLIKSHDNSTNHPKWQDDGMIRDMDKTTNYKAGFISLSHLYNWFEGYLDQLLQVGYVIKSYTVDTQEIISSRSASQLAFRIHN